MQNSEKARALIWHAFLDQCSKREKSEHKQYPCKRRFESALQNADSASQIKHKRTLRYNFIDCVYRNNIDLHPETLIITGQSLREEG